MQLTLWTYEGPPHVGAMRIAASMEGVHYVLHAPQGDTYADLLFTMIERRGQRPPVTYTTFQARVIEVRSGDTAVIQRAGTQELRTVSLASIRTPRPGNRSREEPDEPWAYEAKEMLRISLLREQSIGKAAASHQREDEARRVALKVIAE